METKDDTLVIEASLEERGEENDKGEKAEKAEKGRRAEGCVFTNNLSVIIFNANSTLRNLQFLLKVW